VKLHTGRLAQFRSPLDLFASSRPDLHLWALGAALAARADGDLPAARQTLDAFLNELPESDQDDEFWSNELVVAAQLAWEVDAGEKVADALEVQLHRCSGQFDVFGASSGTFGPVDRALGLLASLRGDHEQSAALHTRAFDQCAPLNTSPWLVWTAADLASELRTLDRGVEARSLGEKMAPMAEQLQMHTHRDRLEQA
jgi:hypothetical protein